VTRVRVSTEMKQSHQRLSQSLSILFAAVPFAFALVRAVRTGDDLRYLWVALAALLGATLAMAMGRTRRTWTSLGLGFTIFVLATLFATAAALLLGTQFGPGVWLVGSGCGVCLAASSVLYALAHPRNI
jgi:peptidoglycan/LPS O-acetylase OafA/YrhL